ALLDAAPVVGAEFAAEVVALLSEEAPREYGDDLAGALRAARRAGGGYAARWREVGRAACKARVQPQGRRPPHEPRPRDRAAPRPFFFSSRRRHTRFSRDWSSDVCSSDLGAAGRGARGGRGVRRRGGGAAE